MYRPRSVLTAAFLTAVSAFASGSAGAQITAGHTDNFEDGTTQNWTVGLGPGGGAGAHPAPPTNISNGGPAGAGDNYLLLSAIGGVTGGAGSKLSVINPFGAWSGNYLAAGITSIALDASNFGTSDLFLRLLFEDPMGGPPADIAYTSAAFFLPGGSGWMHFVFPLVGPGGLVASQGDLTTLLSNTTFLRIYHNPVASPDAAIVAASVGVDNITAIGTAAVVTPEPSTVVLFATGVLPLLVGARRRRRSEQGGEQIGA